MRAGPPPIESTACVCQIPSYLAFLMEGCARKWVLYTSKRPRIQTQAAYLILNTQKQPNLFRKINGNTSKMSSGVVHKRISAVNLVSSAKQDNLSVRGSHNKHIVFVCGCCLFDFILLSMLHTYCRFSLSSFSQEIAFIFLLWVCAIKSSIDL